MQCMALTSLMISCVRIGATLDMCRLQLGQSHANRSWDCNICVPRMKNRIGSFSRSRRSNSNRIHLICGHCFNGQHHRLTSPFNSNLSQPFVCSIFIIIIAHAFTSRLFAVAHSSYPSLSTMYVLVELHATYGPSPNSPNTPNSCAEQIAFDFQFIRVRLVIFILISPQCVLHILDEATKKFYEIYRSLVHWE